jgi:uncharacterized protein YjbI with pentapeptide repeats
MANQEYHDLLIQGVDVWNEWREEHLNIFVDKERSNFRGATFFKEVDIDWSNLISIDLSRATLNNMDLIHSDLGEANLREANLSMANFRGANLRGANLRWVNLRESRLWKADLSGAILKGVHLRMAFLLKS